MLDIDNIFDIEVSLTSDPHDIQIDLSDLRGIKGDKGERGERGAVGETGPAGPVGPQGERGPTGDTGPIGPVGPRGQAGARGPQGKSLYDLAVESGFNGTLMEYLSGIRTLKGEKGDPGERGATGPQGLQGVQGPQGLRGPKGDKGERGAAGEQGPMGPIGNQGPRGLKGDTGPMGPAGPIGPEGPRGETGRAGLRGPEGPRGPQGVAGPRGPAGYEGEISDSYNGNRRNVPVSEYAVGMLNLKVEQPKEAKQVWAGNVTQHSTNIIELSESILNRTLVFYLQWSQAHSLQQNVDTYTVSVFVGEELINTSGRKYFHAALYAGGWKNCQIELVSATQIKIIDISNMYLKKITAA